MSIEAIYTLSVIVLMTVALVRDWAGADFVFFGALCALLFGGVISPNEALAGFSNKGMVMVGMLFIVSSAIQNTGALNGLMYNVLRTDGRRFMPALILRLMIPVSLLSAFVNNTPLVIIFVPIIKNWSQKLRISASKFYIPLSYAAILGGMCTLIGTSTNLVVHGLMIENGFSGLRMFELAMIGIPCAIIGWIYMALFGVRMLPNRKDASAMMLENRKEYVIEMRILQGCELIGKSIQQAGLRNLRGLFLIDIERSGRSLGPISSTETMQAEDRLMFVGITSAVVDLQEIPGLVPVGEGLYDKDFELMTAHLVEVVLSATSPILGKTVKEANFRGKYGAGVIAVHRNGEKIESKIGNIQLKAGDTLLLFASTNFTSNWKDSQDFYLVSSIKTKFPDAQNKGKLALGIMVLMVLFATFGTHYIKLGDQPFTVLHAVFGAGILMVLTRCVPANVAKKSIRWDLLITIGCAFGISRALQNSGGASVIAAWMVDSAAVLGPVGVLVVVYLLTAVTTELLTNNAAAALIFPIALSAAGKLGVSPMPFFIAVTIAASASFSTPIGYQTNLIVQGAGGYRFSDYTRVGLPLGVLCLIVSTVLIPVFWKF